MARVTPAITEQLDSFGASLRRWRLIRSLPAHTVAERAGISRDTLRSIETGQGSPSLAAVFAVAEALGVSAMLTNSVDPLMTQLGRDRAALLERKRVKQ